MWALLTIVKHVILIICKLTSHFGVRLFKYSRPNRRKSFTEWRKHRLEESAIDVRIVAGNVRKQRSVIWNFFDKTEEKTKNSCKDCGKVVTCSSLQTTNMIQHLVNQIICFSSLILFAYFVCTILKYLTLIPRIRAVTRIRVIININVLPLIEGAVVDAKHIPNGPVWVDYHSSIQFPSRRDYRYLHRQF